MLRLFIDLMDMSMPFSASHSVFFFQERHLFFVQLLESAHTIVHLQGMKPNLVNLRFCERLFIYPGARQACNFHLLHKYQTVA